MAKPLPVSIPVSSDIETLRKHLVVNLNNLSLRIAQQDNRTAPMSMGGNRLSDVPDPANATDAVNLRTLKKFVQGISRPPKRESSGIERFNIVWSINGTATGTAPPYIFQPLRIGSPGTVKLFAIGTGTGSTTMNIKYAPKGVIASAVNILTSDIVLPASANGPITASNFNLTLPFSANDVLYAVVTNTGGASNLSLELLVNP